MFRDTLFNDVIHIINHWNPKSKYPNETKYRDELLEYIRDGLNSNNSMFGISRGRVSVKKEDSRGLCDIGIDRRIGIELKKDLKSKAQVNRLIGQIVNYKRDYQDIIILLVGDTNKEALENLKDDLSDLNRGDNPYSLSQQHRIKIINKATKKNKSKSTRKRNGSRNKPFNPLEIDLPKFEPPKFDWKF